MKHRKILMVILSVIAAFVFAVGCGSNSGADKKSALSLGETEVNLDLYEDVSLSVTAPDGAALSWTSSDETVVKVTDGVLSAVSAGTATVTVSDGTNQASAEVTVADSGARPTITIDKNETVVLGGETTLAPEYKYKNAAVKGAVTYTYESGNKDVATVSDKGVVKAEAPGETIITVKANWRNAAEVTETVTVTVKNTVELPETASVKEFEQTAITATANASGAIVWASFATDVATVDDNGVVTGVKAGTATITAYLGEGTATCEVTVEATDIPHVLDLDKTEISVQAKKTSETVTASVSWNDNVLDGDFTYVWTAKDGGEAFATVNQDGASVTFTGVKAGTAVYEVKTVARGYEITGEVIVTISDFDFAFSFENSAVTEDGNGFTAGLILGSEQTGKLTVGNVYAKVNGEVTTDVLAMTWTTEDTSVATVSGGVITGVAPGSATFTGKATYEEKERTVTLTVTVEKGITVDKATASVVEFASVTITATTKIDGTVVWTSSDDGTAIVENGVVTGVKAGTVTITATLGSDSATCEVTVEETTIPHVVTFDKENVNIEYDESETVNVGVTYDGVALTGYDMNCVWEKTDGADVAEVTGTNPVSFKGIAIGAATYKVTVSVRGKTAEKTITVTVNKKQATLEHTFTVETAGSRKTTSLAIPDSVSAADIEKITVSEDVVIYTKDAQTVSGQSVEVVNLPVQMKDLGDEVAVTIETPTTVYTASANVYTMVITTAAEFETWQEVASQHAIDSGKVKNVEQKGAYMDGYFVLGANIEYNKIFTPYKDFGQLWGIADAGSPNVKAWQEAGKQDLLIADWGNGNVLGFHGIFDGKGYTVKGVEINGKFNAFVVTGGNDGIVRNVSFTGVKLGEETSLIFRTGIGSAENIYVELAEMTGASSGEETTVLWRSEGDANNIKNAENVVIDVSACALKGNADKIKLIGRFLSFNGVYKNVCVVGDYNGGLYYGDSEGIRADLETKIYPTYSALIADITASEWGEMWRANEQNTLFIPASVYTVYGGDIAFTNAETEIERGSELALTVTPNGRWITISLKGTYDGVTIEGNVVKVSEDAAAESLTATVVSWTDGKTAEIALTIRDKRATEELGEKFVALNREAQSTTVFDVMHDDTAVEMIYVNGTMVEGGATVEGGKITVAKSVYEAVGTSEKANISIVTNSAIYNYTANIVDYAVATEEEFTAAFTVDNLTTHKHIILENDFDKSGYSFDIGYTKQFNAILDGNGHVIKNMYAEWNGFMYDLAENGVIKNISFTGIKFHNGGDCKIVAYRLYGTLENCFFEATGGVNETNGMPALAAVTDGKAKIVNTVVYVHDRTYQQGNGIFTEANTNSYIDGLYVINTAPFGDVCPSGAHLYSSVAAFAAEVTTVPEGFGEGWVIAKGGLLMPTKAAEYYEAEYGSGFAVTAASEIMVNQDVEVKATLNGAAVDNAEWTFVGLDAGDYTFVGGVLVVTNTAKNGSTITVKAEMARADGLYYYTAEKSISINGIVEKHNASEYEEVVLDKGLTVNAEYGVDSLEKGDLDLSQIYDEKMNANEVTVTYGGSQLYKGTISGASLEINFGGELFADKGSDKTEFVFTYTADGVNYEYHLPVYVKAEIKLNRTVIPQEDAAAKHLQSIINAYPTATFALTEDIDMNGKTLLYIDEFKGVLDGNGYAIMNTQISYASADNGWTPRFIQVNSGVIKDLRVEISDYNIEAGSGTRGFVYKNNGTISNVYFNAYMYSELNAEKNDDGTWKHHFRTGNDVYSSFDYASTGLFTSINNGKIENCVINFTAADNIRNSLGANVFAVIALENNGTISNTYAMNNGLTNAGYVYKGNLTGYTVDAIPETENFSSADGWNACWSRTEEGKIKFGTMTIIENTFFDLATMELCHTLSGTDLGSVATPTASYYQILDGGTKVTDNDATTGTAVYQKADVTGNYNSSGKVNWAQNQNYYFTKYWFAVKVSTESNFFSTAYGSGATTRMTADKWYYIYVDVTAGNIYWSEQGKYGVYKYLFNHPYMSGNIGGTEYYKIFDFFEIIPADDEATYTISVTDVYSVYNTATVNLG